MTDAVLREIHNDLEILKHDVSQLKDALLGSSEGELSDWAKERISTYLKRGTSKTVTQKEVEKEFL